MESTEIHQFGLWWTSCCCCISATRRMLLISKSKPTMRYLLLRLYFILAVWSDAFSPSPHQSHFSDDQDIDVEEFFFIGANNGKVSNVSNHRRRFGVNFVPMNNPRPPLHPPDWATLELAESRLPNTEQATDLESTHIDASSLLAAVASGLWTMTPILYYHCIDQQMLSLSPLLLLIAALEVVTMLYNTVQPDESFSILVLFVVFKVSVAYCMSAPLNLPFEILEGLILFASSSLVMEAFATHPDTHQTAVIDSQGRNQNQQKPPFNIQRGIQ